MAMGENTAKCKDERFYVLIPVVFEEFITFHLRDISINSNPYFYKKKYTSKPFINTAEVLFKRIAIPIIID